MDLIIAFALCVISCGLLYTIHRQSSTNTKMDRFIELCAELLSENRAIIDKLSTDEDSS